MRGAFHAERDVDVSDRSVSSSLLRRRWRDAVQQLQISTLEEFGVGNLVHTHQGEHVQCRLFELLELLAIIRVPDGPHVVQEVAELLLNDGARCLP